jgi:hypothetical protein
MVTTTHSSVARVYFRKVYVYRFVVAIALAGKVVAGVLYRLIWRGKVVVKYKKLIGKQLTVIAHYKYRCIKVKRMAGSRVVSIPPQPYGKLRRSKYLTLAFL